MAIGAMGHDDRCGPGGDLGVSCHGQRDVRERVKIEALATNEPPGELMISKRSAAFVGQKEDACNDISRDALVDLAFDEHDGTKEHVVRIAAHCSAASTEDA